MEPALITACAIVFSLIMIVTSITWAKSRSDEILRRWQQETGKRIVRRERCWLWHGPYTFRTSRGQVVWRVTVQTQDGRLRRGWLRLGGWFRGLWADAVHETWDD